MIENQTLHDKQFVLVCGVLYEWNPNRCSAAHTGGSNCRYALYTKSRRHKEEHKHTILLLIFAPPPAGRQVDFRDNLRNFVPEYLLAGNDFLDLGVELRNVDFLSGVLGFNVGGNGEIVGVTLDFLIACQMGEVRFLRTGGKGGNDPADISRRQLVVVRDLDALAGSVNEQGLVVGLSLLQNHDTGCDGRAEEQVAGELDNAVDEVVVDQILSDFPLLHRHDT